jgi:hypothetical protein
LVFSGDDIIDFSLTRFPPGEARIKRWNVDRMLSRIDAYRKAEGEGPMPWGSIVAVRLPFTLFTDAEASAGRLRDDIKHVEIETSPFLYVLPATAWEVFMDAEPVLGQFLAHARLPEYGSDRESASFALAPMMPPLLGR